MMHRTDICEVLLKEAYFYDNDIVVYEDNTIRSYVDEIFA